MSSHFGQLSSLYNIQPQMKLNMFRVRKNNTEEASLCQQQDSRAAIPLQRHPDPSDFNNNFSLKTCHENMNKLMSMFQTFLRVSTEQHQASPTNIHQSQTYIKTQLHYQNRDRHVILTVPSLPESTPTQAYLERWFTETAFAAFSSSFNFYLTQQMTFQQAKIFCSETILANLLRFTERYPLNQDQITALNEHFSNKLLDYLQRKYPLTLNTDVNKALQKELHTTNNFDLLSNDFLYSNGIIFTYRESGNYNDMIMKVINKSFEIVDGVSHFTSDAQSLTNFQDFETYMSTLFQKVYKEEWMNINKSSIKVEKEARVVSEQKQKYAQRVKNYTSYAIGRKISQNTPHFTPQEINSYNLEIKSPAILRILTKWCEELWQKFQTQSYYSQRAEPILLQDPQFINPFFKWMKAAVDNKMAAQKQKILEFKKTLDRHANYQESVILLKYLQEDQINFIPKYQKAYGMFASHMVKNLHSYIVLYLNRLIHGLLTVSKLFYQKDIDKSWQMWQSPPNLVTFKIGDLMRCKCSSKEKEIIKIYKEINTVSSANPQKMKIVRIKNRLREGTNDILINVKFNDLIICEIQLEVNNKSKSKFIQCSNAFSHYIYELRRSIFGPITELCNIWNNFDSRSKTFNNLIVTQQTMVNSSQRVVVPQCKAQKHQFQNHILPFQCSICQKLYFHNNYILDNERCRVCQTYKCARCKIRLLSDQELKQCLFKGKQGKTVQNLTKLTETKLPDTGACLKIQSTTPKIQIFRKMKVETNTWLFGRTNSNELYQIAKVNNPKETNQFFRNYFVFNLKLDPPKEVAVSNQQAVFFSVREYIRESYNREKEQLVLTQVRLNNNEMNQLATEVGTQKDKKKIKRIEFASNYLSTFEFFAPFENLTEINLDYNHIANTSFLLYFKKLEKLQIRDNSKLQVIGNQLCELQHLQQLKLNACPIKTLPHQIHKLTALKVLTLEKNRLKSIPQQVCKLKNLNDLSLKTNFLETLPKELGDLTALRKLNVSRNSLSRLPDSLQNLLNLVSLNVSNNMISVLPAGLRKMQKLQKFQASINKICELDEHIFEIQSLKNISLAQNKLKVFNCNLAQCKNLQNLSLDSNQITSITDTIGTCSNLVVLQLQVNQLTSLPASLTSLQQLSPKINLRKNKFSQWPQFVLNFARVQGLDFSENELTCIPPQICNLRMLDSLNLSGNKIESIPPEFTALKELNKLQFRSNCLSNIPDFIIEFQCFKNKPVTFLFDTFTFNHISQIPVVLAEKLGPKVVFNYNKLTAIPQCIKEKANVTLINFQNNCIREIPHFIQEFVNLNELNLRFNLIEIVPVYLAELKKIRKNALILGNNPIKTIECPEFLQLVGNIATRELVTQAGQKPAQKQQQSSQSDD